ncbi:Imm45 family immunity protein [Kushneria sp. Sum13]|uniref:Imm45 family immunity protein n=1 Tax=Kushneria sp. Sum13 TaxID=3459196 RepID=UPI004045763B
MTEFERLVDREGKIGRGAVLRFPAKWPYEEVVDFMLVELPHDQPYRLIVSSGYKAGLTALILPVESYIEKNWGVDVAWLKSNWNYWVYAECQVEEVMIADNYSIVNGSVKWN